MAVYWRSVKLPRNSFVLLTTICRHPDSFGARAPLRLRILHAEPEETRGPGTGIRAVVRNGTLRAMIFAVGRCPRRRKSEDRSGSKAPVRPAAGNGCNPAEAVA
jgi:hypothetical protein